MRSNRRQLNATKTEVLWCASARRQDANHQIYHFSSGLMLAVKPVRCVRDLFGHLHRRTSVHENQCLEDRLQLLCCATPNPKHIRRSVSKPVLLSLVSSLVLSRLDSSLCKYGTRKTAHDRVLHCSRTYIE